MSVLHRKFPIAWVMAGFSWAGDIHHAGGVASGFEKNKTWQKNISLVSPIRVLADLLRLLLVVIKQTRAATRMATQ